MMTTTMMTVVRHQTTWIRGTALYRNLEQCLVLQQVILRHHSHHRDLSRCRFRCHHSHQRDLVLPALDPISMPWRPWQHPAMAHASVWHPWPFIPLQQWQEREWNRQAAPPPQAYLGNQQRVPAKTEPPMKREASVEKSAYSKKEKPMPKPIDEAPTQYDDLGDGCFIQQPQ